MERTLLKLALLISLKLAIGDKNNYGNEKKKHKKGEPDIILVIIDQSLGSFLLYFKWEVLMNDKIKYDYGKPRLALVPPESIRAIGEVMTYGVTKYYEGSWREVEPWRYRDAMMRHLVYYLEDPYSIDKESGLPHLWHLTTNAAILCELEANNIATKSSPLMKEL